MVGKIFFMDTLEGHGASGASAQYMGELLSDCSVDSEILKCSILAFGYASKGLKLVFVPCDDTFVTHLGTICGGYVPGMVICPPKYSRMFIVN
jgi:hypothetical protein